MIDSDSLSTPDTTTASKREELVEAVREGYHPKTAAIVVGTGRTWLAEQLNDPTFAATLEAAAAQAATLPWYAQALDVLRSGNAVGAAVARRINVPWKVVRSEYTHNPRFKEDWHAAAAAGAEQRKQAAATRQQPLDRPSKPQKVERSALPRNRGAEEIRELRVVRQIPMRNGSTMRIFEQDHNYRASEREQPGGVTNKESKPRHIPSERQQLKDDFLVELRKGSDQNKAAQAVGRTLTTIYDWRDDDPAFRDAWTAIMEDRRQRAEQARAAKRSQQRERSTAKNEQQQTVQRLFLDALREGLWQYEAAKRAGVAMSTLFTWKRHDSSFSDAWDAIIAQRREPTSTHKQDVAQRQKEQTQKRKTAQRAFLKALRSGQSQRKATKQSGVAWSTLYHWKQTDSAFREAWDKILAEQQSNQGEDSMVEQQVS